MNAEQLTAHIQAERLTDLTQSVVLLCVMFVLIYGVHLFKIELRAALLLLRTIVRAQDEIKVRLDAIERERGLKP